MESRLLARGRSILLGCGRWSRDTHAGCPITEDSRRRAEVFMKQTGVSVVHARQNAANECGTVTEATI